MRGLHLHEGPRRRAGDKLQLVRSCGPRAAAGAGMTVYLEGIETLDALGNLHASLEGIIRADARRRLRLLQGPTGRARRRAIEEACAILERDGHALRASALTHQHHTAARELDHGGRLLLAAAANLRRELLP